MSGVPTFDREALFESGLAPEILDFLQRELDHPAGPMQHRAEIETTMVRTVMEALGVSPVYGRDGLLVYSVNIDGKVLVFGLAPDIEKDSLPLNCLTREWVEVSSLPELIDQLTTWARAMRELEEFTPELLAEDHPEENAIGFFAPGPNKVWLLSGADLTRDLMEGNLGNWAAVPHLIQSSTGREELAKLIVADKLMTREAFLKSMGVTPKPGGRQTDIVIDLLSGTLADRYKRRYLKGGADAP